jgi:alanyl-tRNA synthetase
MPSANEIRQQFIDFFVKKHGHTAVPSSSVVPLDDPTLLFTNAGMNQFKDVFLGTGTRPYRRAVDTQKCIRAGGKHNDLDDVGKDTYHHTFFEMLGNWSFGDYFKKEAIAWAWELLTGVWKLDKGRLHVTVFEGDPKEGLAPDDEAAELWRSQTDIDPSHVHKGNKKDNFWEMGETGPCGPCTEIHIDRTPDKSGGRLVNKGTPDVMEIWNLVFIQFNRGADRKLTPLPAKHVDTGMGFERMTAVLQGKSSNYDTDVFTPIMDALSDLTSRKYGGKLDDLRDISFRVIADHVRMATFAITDGARPGNKKRDAVLRSVIRRAVRFGYQYLDQREPFLYKLVPVLVQQMGGAFPELRHNPDQVAEVVRTEEAEFLRTIQRGITHFNSAIVRATQQDASSAQICGEDAAKLHTTYGFPIDLTEQMASEVGMTVDRVGYDAEMEKHRQISSQGVQEDGPLAMSTDVPPTDDQLKWSCTQCDAQILGLMGHPETAILSEGQGAHLFLDRTCFYAEAGGQIGDRGTIITDTGHFEVRGTRKIGSVVLHLGHVTAGQIGIGQRAHLKVDVARLDIMRNHTATHLLNWALRKVLGEHVEQKGSLVDADKTRFDFTHPQALTAEQIAEVERLVNERVYADLPVRAVTLPLAEAKKIQGVRAVFGEKYPDSVRVLLIGPESPEKATREHSVEFCGGTHLAHTGQAGFFKIVSQEPVAKGVRRVTGVTGREAVATVQRLSGVVDELTARLNCKADELSARVEALQEEVKKLQGQLKKGAAGDLAGAGDRLLASAAEANGARIIVGEVPAAPVDQLRAQADRLRQKAKSAVVVLGWTEEGKVGLLAAVTDDLTKKGLAAGKLIGEVAKVVGGKGGGRPDMAQAGGSDPSKLGEALQLAKKLAAEKLGA